MLEERVDSKVIVIGLADWIAKHVDLFILVHTLMMAENKTITNGLLASFCFALFCSVLFLKTQLR